MPQAQSLRGGVLLIPGADARGFEEDQREAASHGIAARVLELPPPPPHIVDPAHFAKVANLIESAAAEWRSEYADARVAAIGRNNGGGQLAYCAAQGVSFDAIVLTGAILEISAFVARSAHPSAVAIREIGPANPTELASLDIVATLPRVATIPCLLQLGHRDPMLDEGAREAADRLAGSAAVQWLDEDHAMAGEVAVAARWSFLAGILKG